MEDFSSGTANEQRFSYRGKHYVVPVLSPEGGHSFTGDASRAEDLALPEHSPVLEQLGSVWDLRQFSVPRGPVSLGLVPPEHRALFSRPGVARVLDLPVKFPGSPYRVPSAFAQFLPVLQRLADVEARLNPRCLDEYYAYLTIDQRPVHPGTLHREAPCHVDGFQGARWSPKVRINHTYTVSDCVPTVYYPMPFETAHLDEARHDFFWDFNRQVANVNSAVTWRPADWELTLMDAYSVHRGDAAPRALTRTWLRLSFEVRLFDRLGNGHNPLFQYDWPMVPRDIEALNLAAWDQQGDPSLRVFPWQKPDGSALDPDSLKTQPALRPRG